MRLYVVPLLQLVRRPLLHRRPYAQQSSPIKCAMYACHLDRWRHLLFNAVAQLVVGIPLELMHGAVRTALVYIAGVFAGISCRFACVIY